MNTEKRLRTAVPAKPSSPSGRHAANRRAAPPRKATLSGRVRYRLDLALSRGALVVIGYLGVAMLAIILLSAAILTVLHMTGVNGGARLGFTEAFWQSLLRVLDSGSFAADQGWTTRVLGLLVTLTGIFLAGSLIGLIATAVDQQIANLRKGRSAVLEHDHTLVLGWSPRLPVILSELVIANANRRRAGFVVLADRPKDEMEDELRMLVPDTGTTRVVCRTGDPGRPDDLQLVNVTGARSVIVLAGEEGDAGVVKAVLAVRSIDPAFEHTSLVAELESVDHADTLRSLTDYRIATVQADEVISQVTAQACHQNGLAGVFRDLLDFDGDEIYFTAVPELTGHPYRDIVRAFDTSSVMGVLRDGSVQLNPPADFVFADGDEVITISADDQSVAFTGFAAAPEGAVVAGMPFAEPAQRIALVGWSSLGVTVLRELDQFLGDGSVIDLVVDRSFFTADEIELPAYEHCTVEVHVVPSGPAALPAVIAEHDYDQAIVLGYRRRLKASQADARTMLTLLALNKAWADRVRRPRVVAEMLDRGNVDIAQTTGVDDFIVSDELSSLMIAQVSERLELQDVFRELFDADGCFVALHPAVLYAPDETVSYASIVASAVERGESALGYRVGRDPVVLNPRKSARVTLGVTDQVLVLGPRGERPAAPPAAEQIPAPVALVD
jgi:voltage-gated potassium channel Kch